MKILSLRCFTLLIFQLACLLFAPAAIAADREVQATFYWYAYGGHPPRWSSPNGAMEPYTKVPQTRNHRIEGAWENNYYYYNGMPVYTKVAWEYFIGGVWKPAMGLITLGYECPIGTQVKTTGVDPQYIVTCVDPTTVEPPCDSCASQASKTSPKERAGNPIYPATGLKVETAVDYSGGPSNSLQFVRTYRSDRNGWSHNFEMTGIDYNSPGAANSEIAGCYRGAGNITREVRCSPFLPRGVANDFTLQRSNGRRITFGTANDLRPLAANVTDRVSKVLDTQGNTTAWEVFNATSNATETYDPNGRVIGIRQRDGRSQTFTYSDELTLPEVAPRAGLLLSVTDNFGYQLTFTYDANARLSTMTSPDGEVTTYRYDEPSSVILSGRTPVGNLTSVTYPNGKKRIYWYNEQDKTANNNYEFALTGITDENGVRYATFTYLRNTSENRQWAVTSEHVGGVEKYRVEPWGPTEAYVTDPMGQRNYYTYAKVAGIIKLKSADQKAGAGSPASSVSSSFDAQGNVATTTDARGMVTTFTYDLTRNLEISRTEAAGKPEARTIKTEWHPTLNIVSRISEPKQRTTMTFDADGNVLTRTVQATTDANGSLGFNATLVGQPRVWTYTYNSFGQVLTETAPRTDALVRTTYTYDSSGNLKTVTNPAGQVTTFNTYDANGRPTMITAPNGRVERLSYLPRGWLQSRTVEAAGGTQSQTTSYSYDDVGQLTSVTMPDQSSIYYTYDPAHRLTDVQDSLGNKIHYTLDNMGNRISEQVTDPSGVLARQITRQYDVLSRVQSQTGGL